MPLAWIEPDVAVEHKGVTVYHTYKDSGEYVTEYWYTLVPEDDDIDGESAFDIRDLDVECDDKDHTEILKAAIDAGLLRSPDEE